MHHSPKTILSLSPKVVPLSIPRKNQTSPTETRLLNEIPSAAHIKRPITRADEKGLKTELRTVALTRSASESPLSNMFPDRIESSSLMTPLCAGARSDLGEKTIKTPLTTYNRSSNGHLLPFSKTVTEHQSTIQTLRKGQASSQSLFSSFQANVPTTTSAKLGSSGLLLTDPLSPGSNNVGTSGFTTP